MGLLRTAGNGIGLVLLGVAGVAAVYGVLTIALVLLLGFSNARVGGVVFAVPLAMLAGTFGAVLRKVVAGTVLPIDYDVADAYRSFIGGG